MSHSVIDLLPRWGHLRGGSKTVYSSLWRSHCGELRHEASFVGLKERFHSLMLLSCLLLWVVVRDMITQEVTSEVSFLTP